MIQSVQKVIKIGSSVGVTVPAKELKRQQISVGDEVEITVRPFHASGDDNIEVIKAAKDILTEYKEDFVNLANR